MTRNQATVCGSTSSNTRHGDRRADVLRQRREHEQRLRRAPCSSVPSDRRARRWRWRSAPSLNRSSRTARDRCWQISCHSGWKLNQPASGKPICSAVYFGVLVADRLRRAGRHRHQLCLARALHRDEPERRLVDRLADREQPVVLVDRRLAGRELGGELLAGLDLEHDRAALLGDHRVVLVEDAGVLGERGERDAERAERLAVRRVRVGGGDDVGPGLVDRGVDHERGPVDRVLAVHDLAGVVDQDQVADPHVAEADAERVDPEVVGELGIAHRDVAGDALAESEPAEDPQRAGELVLAVVALLLDGGERRRNGQRRPAFGVNSTPSIIGVSWTRRGHARLGDGHVVHATAGPCASMRP